MKQFFILLSFALLTISCANNGLVTSHFPVGVYEVDGVQNLRVEFTGDTKCYVEEIIDGNKTMYRCDYILIEHNERSIYRVSYRQKIMEGCETGKALNIVGNEGVLFHREQLRPSCWQLDCSQNELTRLNY
ncbi:MULTISPECIES: hypothetical protein [Flammeovirga]|uniref:Lipoprotein n=1 Tax=Flammeovirga agarivorans TaxID=2726742 RepID=A0A7X8SNZ4_9BACT|nr:MULTISPECIES: hypothetical protein [Flammeovirga]NLR93733.1 hypothetical protein [Flammeovirga agarivorans]